MTTALSIIIWCYFNVLQSNVRGLFSVLALAYGSSDVTLTFVGMVGIIDPPRDGIREAVTTLLSTGATLKMVTGDAEETALSIGGDLAYTAMTYSLFRL